MRKLNQELDKLSILVAVVTTGKINEAADILHLSQPSVSRAIQILEDAYGTEIFVRSRDGVKLTEAGTLLYEYAFKMLKGLEDIQVRAKSPSNGITGKITVGTYESLAEYLWPSFIGRLESTYPDLELSIKTALNRDPLIDLNRGAIDLLVDAEPQTKDSFISWPLYADKFRFYVSSSIRKGDFSIDETMNETVTFVERAFDSDRVTIEGHLERAGHRFARRYCFDSFSTSKLLAIQNKAIAVLPTRLARGSESKKLIKRVTLDGFNPEGFGKHTICATTTAENRKDSRIRALVTLLKSHLK